jgi:hypothetical protein
MAYRIIYKFKPDPRLNWWQNKWNQILQWVIDRL